MTSSAALTANAPLDYRNSASRPMFVEFVARFETVEEADAFVALFPKSSKFRTSPVSGQREDGTFGYLYARVATRPILASTKGNDRNETGIARYFAIMAKAASLGLAVEWKTPYGNSIPTREEFEALIAE